MTQLIIFGLIFLGMWFLMIAPNRKRQKLHQQMLLGLRSGDRVLFGSGIFGKIVGIRGTNCTIEVSRGVRVDVLRSCIQRRLETGEAGERPDDDEVGDGGEESPAMPSPSRGRSPRRRAKK